MPFCHLPWPQRETGMGHAAAKVPQLHVPAANTRLRGPLLWEALLLNGPLLGTPSVLGQPAAAPQGQEEWGPGVFGVLVCPGMAMQGRGSPELRQVRATQDGTWGQGGSLGSSHLGGRDLGHRRACEWGARPRPQLFQHLPGSGVVRALLHTQAGVAGDWLPQLPESVEEK